MLAGRRSATSASSIRGRSLAPGHTGDPSSKEEDHWHPLYVYYHLTYSISAEENVYGCVCVYTIDDHWYRHLNVYIYWTIIIFNLLSSSTGCTYNSMPLKSSTFFLSFLGRADRYSRCTTKPKRGNTLGAVLEYTIIFISWAQGHAHNQARRGVTAFPDAPPTLLTTTARKLAMVTLWHCSGHHLLIIELRRCSVQRHVYFNTENIRHISIKAGYTREQIKWTRWKQTLNSVL